LLCLRNARAFPLLPAALASVPFGFVLVRVRVRCALQGRNELAAERSRSVYVAPFFRGLKVLMSASCRTRAARFVSAAQANFPFAAVQFLITNH